MPNGDFETLSDSVLCPVGGMDACPPWVSPSGGSPNYFNSCTTLQPNYSVPQNIWGYQFAHSGTGYANIGVYETESINQNHREYIQVKLIDSLNQSLKYIVNLFVNLSDSSSYAVDKIGVYFSDTAIHKSIYDASPFTNFTPQIENTQGNIITDKLNWVNLSWVYTASGGEQFITIGNFYENINTGFLVVDGTINQGKYSCYYIDDVSVTLIEDTFPSENHFNVPNAFTPNNDTYNDNFAVHGKNIENISGKIFNRWGQELYTITNPDDAWDGKYNGNEVSEGVYFYTISVTFTNGEIQEKHGSIQLIR